MSEKHVILNYVDTPLKILLWTIPEILMFLGPCFVGLIIDQLTLGFGTSVVLIWGYKKYQRCFGKGQFQAVKYWFLPPDLRLKAFPKSYIREYLG